MERMGVGNWASGVSVLDQILAQHYVIMDLEEQGS